LRYVKRRLLSVATGSDGYNRRGYGHLLPASAENIRHKPLTFPLICGTVMTMHSGNGQFDRGNYLSYRDFQALLHAEVEKVGSQKAFAIDAGVSQQYVTDLLKGRRKPGRKILAWLKLRKVQDFYERE
jgi:hypothetical protein